MAIRLRRVASATSSLNVVVAIAVPSRVATLCSLTGKYVSLASTVRSRIQCVARLSGLDGAVMVGFLLDTVTVSAALGSE